jgi:hypothetical protein
MSITRPRARHTMEGQTITEAWALTEAALDASGWLRRSSNGRAEPRGQLALSHGESWSAKRTWDRVVNNSPPLWIWISNAARLGAARSRVRGPVGSPYHQEAIDDDCGAEPTPRGPNARDLARG